MIGLDRTVLKLGTALVNTDTLRRVLAGAPVAFAGDYIVALDGPPGCGKTTALTQLIRAHPAPSCAVSLDPCSTNKGVVSQVYEAIFGTRPPRRRTNDDLIYDIRVELASARRLLVIDEAQNSSVSALQMIRNLFANPTSQFDLVLCGSGVEAKLKSEAMLCSRVGMSARFLPIPNEKIPATLSALHPIFARADPNDLMRVDAQICKGVLREWIKVLAFLPQFAPPAGEVTICHLEQALTVIEDRDVRLSP